MGGWVKKPKQKKGFPKPDIVSYASKVSVKLMVSRVCL